MLPPGSSQYLWLFVPVVLLFHHPVTFGGFACLSNPCVFGVCIDDLNTSYSCYCIDGYTGIQCQTNWDECWSNPCQNGGICHDGIATYNCSCPPGFVGDFCEEDYNECESSPCLNNGSCIDRANGYACLCPAGYSGIHCEIDVAVCNATNETRCANGGICVEGPGVTFSCRCQPGWGGFLCESEIDECMSAPCQNGAVCVDLHADYACACLFGYTGKNCEETILHCEDDPCRNGALCLTEEGHPVCYCVPDYHGDRCQYQYDECQLGPKCKNGGTCIDGVDSFTCSCPPNLTGVFCECLIIGSNQLDCTYIATTISTTSGIVLTTLSTTETPKTITEITTKSEDFNLTTSIFTQVPNISTVFTENVTSSFYSTETSTIYNITEISSSMFPNTTLAMTSETISSTETTTEWYSLLETTTEEMLTSTTEKITEPTETEVYSTTESPEYTTERLTTLEEPSTTLEAEPSTTPEYTSTTTEQEVTSTTEEILPTILTTLTTTERITTTTSQFNITTEAMSSTSKSTTESYPITSTEPFTETTTQSISSTFDTTTTEETSTKYQEQSTLPIEQTVSPTVSFSTSTVTTEANVTTTTEVSEIPTQLSSITTYLTEKPTTLTSTTESLPIIPETSSTSTELTTVSRENVTKSIIPDCTSPENGCRNGGTCIYTSEGYKCICPYDAEGPLCEVVLGIRNAAFTGDSYLTHRLMNTSGTEIEFTTKTLSPSGLIFYSNIDSTYMALFLEGGYLKFIFSCGYQTMLLSELRNPVNDGFEMKITAHLEFSKDFKRCNATVMVNNTLTMSGNQIAAVNQLIKPASIVHLGGLPQEKLKEHIPSGGFMGCITNLKIFGKQVDIFREAEDGFKISECSSLACLSSPCSNGGTCIENDDDWHCHCKNGYLGKLCESSVCDNNPCLFGATCLPFTGNGYICLCPFGKHGHFCENELETSEPYFSSSIRGYSSYAAYPIPVGGISSNMEVKFEFIPSTMDQISILMFIGQMGSHDASSDHMAVSFVKGYIMLTWNLGSGPRRIFTSRPITKGKSSYLLKLGRFGRRAWLSVDNLGNVTGRSPGNLAQLDVVPILYLGGHNSPNFSILPHDLPLHSGFSGCIFDVELRSGNLVIPLQTSRQVVGRAVGQCGMTECHDKLCQNNGACLHHGGTFTCLCQDGWFGPLCSTKYNPCDYNRSNCSAGSTCVPLLTDYECDCPVEKTGKYCEKDEKLSDVSLSGKRSYMSLKPTNFEASKFTIELQLRPLGDRGLVLFIGQTENSFLSLSMQSGLLELRVLPAKRKLNGGEVLAIRSNKLLAMGVWYKVRLGKYGNKMFMYVENILNTGLLRNGELLSISGEVIYLGGLPDMSELPNAATSGLPTSFTGCVRQLMINSQHIPLTSEYITSGRNIADCDGTPCGGDACENGGTCWLDSNLNPHCSCLEPYVGEKCESIPSCQEKLCQNRGKCLNSKCSCIVGYTGAFCETAIRVHTPEFLGNSHLILKRSSNEKKRALSNMALQYLNVNFTTAEQNGLILWSSKGNNFIGIGLEKGYLKVAYGTNDVNKTLIEIPSTKPIGDGLWHNLEISFDQSILQVRLDRKLLHPKSKYDQVKLTSSIPTNGIFYLGGLPSKYSLREKTYGLFSQTFLGCIKTVTFNAEKSVTDFSMYEGENVGVCSIL